MEWIEDLELGLVDMDAQHRNIYVLIQHIHTADERGNRSGISDAIVELEQVTRAHFEYEERLMVTYDYPDLVIHTAEHAKLLLEVQGYKDNAVFTTQQLARILFNWLTSHIMMVNRQLALHVLRLRTNAGDTKVTELTGAC